MALQVKVRPHVAPLSTKGAAAYLGVSVQFLNMDRHVSMQSNTPPTVPYLRIGTRLIRYRKENLDAVLAKSRVTGAEA